MSNGHLRCNTSTGGALILHSHPAPSSVFLVLEHGSATYPLTGAAMLRVFLGGGKETGWTRGGEAGKGASEGERALRGGDSSPPSKSGPRSTGSRAGSPGWAVSAGALVVVGDTV